MPLPYSLGPLLFALLLQPLPKFIQPLALLSLLIHKLLLTGLLEFLAPVCNVSLEFLGSEETPIHDPHTSLGRLGVSESYACDAFGFAVEEDDVGDLPDFRAFFADVFFDFEGGGWIFL